jgi:hypothetical protein
VPPSSNHRRDPRVDAYIAELPDWQQAICSRLRDLIHGVDPEMSETIKRSDRPYFVLDGNVCALLAAKDHVNLFLYDAPSLRIPQGSSLAVTTTRQRGRLPTAVEKRSKRDR